MITTTYNNRYLNLQLLPEQVQIQAFDYVQYLVLKYYTTSQINEIKDISYENTRQFGKFKGKIKISADFNEPIDDFKDY